MIGSNWSSMSHHQGDDAEYLAEENKMEDVEEDGMDILSINREGNDVDSDDDEYDFSVSNMFLSVFFLMFYDYDIDEYFSLYDKWLCISYFEVLMK